MKPCLFTNVFATQPLEKAVAAAAKSGFEAVELLVGWGADHLEHDTPQGRVEEIRQMVEEAGLAVACVYTSLGGRAHFGAADGDNRAQLDTLRLFCEKCAVLSCDLIKLTCGRLSGEVADRSHIRRAAEWLRVACNLAAEYHIRLVAEVHHGQMMETVQQAEEVAALVERDNFGIIHDAGNLFVAGADCGGAGIARLGERVFHVHIKDMERCSRDVDGVVHYRGEHFRGAFLGEGDVDYGSVLRALHRIGYAGYLSCECMRKDDPWETAKRESATLRRMLASLGS